MREVAVSGWRRHTACSVDLWEASCFVLPRLGRPFSLLIDGGPPFSPYSRTGESVPSSKNALRGGQSRLSLIFRAFSAFSAPAPCILLCCSFQVARRVIFVFSIRPG